MKVITSPRLRKLEEELKAERTRLYNENNARLWAHVKGLDKDDLDALEHLIHEDLHGEGDDD